MAGFSTWADRGGLTRRRVLAVGTAAVLALGSASAWAQTAPAPEGSAGSVDPRTLPRDQRPAPAEPSVTADASEHGVKVSWKNAPENAESFTVTRTGTGEPAALGPVSGRSHVDRDAEPGQTYTYTVAVAEVNADAGEGSEAAAVVGQELGSAEVTTPEDDSGVGAASAGEGKRGESRRDDQRVGAAAVPSTDRDEVRAAAEHGCQRAGTATTETWNPTDCPGGYQITGDLTVPDGVVVTIAPGTLVLVDVAVATETATAASTDAVDILVEGSLVSAGNGEDPVVFTSSADDGNADTAPEPAAGDWGNLAFLGSEGGSLSFTQVRYGNKILADGFSLPLSDVLVEQMLGADPDGGYHRGGVDYRNIPDGASVSIARLTYDGVLGVRDDDPTGPAEDPGDTGVYLTNYGDSVGADTAGFSVAVVDSAISGWFPLYIEHDAFDRDSVVDLTVTGSTITDTADSTSLSALVYQGYSDTIEVPDAPGSALLTGSISGSTVSSALGEGIYLEAETAASDTTTGAADAACVAGTFGACNNVSLTDNSVTTQDDALMHYAWVDEGPGDVISAPVLSGGSYTSGNRYAADLEAWTDDSGAAHQFASATDVTFSASRGVFSYAESDGGSATSSPSIEGVTLTGGGWGWDNEAYGSDENSTPGDATANPVITASSFDSANSGLYNYAYAGNGSATANPSVTGSTLRARNGDGIYNEVYSDLGSAEGSPSVTNGSRILGDSGDGIYNEVYAADDVFEAEPAVAGPTAVGNPVIDLSHVEGDDSGVYNYVESGTGAATAAPRIVNGSSIEADDDYGLDNEAYAADHDGDGAATATPTVVDSSIRSDDYGVYNEAYASNGDSPADGSFTLTRSSVSAEYDEGWESYVSPSGTGAGALNPQITSSSISAPDDYGMYLDLETDEGPGSVGGFITDSSVTSYDNAFYVDLETTGGAGMTTAVTGSDLFSEYYEVVYIEVDDDLLRSDSDMDTVDDTAVSAGTSVTPTFTDSRLRNLDDDEGLYIDVEGSGNDAADVVELSPVLDGVTIDSYYDAVYLYVEDDSHDFNPNGDWPGRVLLGGRIDNSSIDSLDGSGVYAEADCYDCTGGSLLDLSANNTDVFAYDDAGYFDAYSSDADATLASVLTSDRGSSWRSYDDASVYSYSDASGDGSTATNDMVVRGLHLGAEEYGVDLEAYSSSGDALNGSVIDDNVIDGPWGDNGYAGVDDYTYSGGSFAFAAETDTAAPAKSVRTGSISGNTITGKGEGIDHYIGRSSGTQEFNSLVIANNTISNVSSEGIEADGNGFAPEGGTEDFLLISGNTISSTGREGIQVDGLATRIVNNDQRLSGLNGGSSVGGIEVRDATVQGLVACNTVVGNRIGVEYNNNGEGLDPLTNRNTFELPDGTTNRPYNLVTDNAGTTDATENFFGTGTEEELRATVNNDRNTEAGPQGTVVIDPMLASPPDCSAEPKAVTAVPGNGSATVAWLAPASDRGAEITGYRVTASPGGRTCTTDGALTCTVTGLTNGTAYTFTVVAINAIGDSPPSAPSNSVIPTAAPTAPGTPTASAGDTTANVSWTAPSTDGGSPITGYRVTSAPGGKTCTTTGALTCTVTGLTNGQAYTFSVVALNATGTGPASGPSNSIVPAGVPDAPGAPTATAGDRTATVSWAAPSFDGGRPVTSYRVSASPGDGACDAIGTTTCTVDGLTNGTAYTFTVTATNAVGTSPESSASNSVTPQMRATTVTGQSSASSSDLPPSASNPLVVTVISPVPGEFSFTPVTPSPMNGWRTAISAMEIEAPTGTVDNPLRMVFRVDSSALQAGVPAGVFRDGRLATACTGETRADPDPCQLSQTVLDDGDLQIVVFSTHASVWQVAQPAPGSIGAACTGVGATPFTDVADNTHRDAIACLVAYEITKGSTATTYTPFGSVTRAQMASFIARTLKDAGVTMPSGDKAVFTDVANGGEHSTAINQLAALDVVEGVTDTRYAPNDMVSRAQMASFISRAYERATGLAVPSTASAFGDVAGNTHEANINKIAILGVTVGTNATTYQPFAPVARDQMASFLARTMNLFVVGGQAVPASN